MEARGRPYISKMFKMCFVNKNGLNGMGNENAESNKKVYKVGTNSKNCKIARSKGFHSFIKIFF